MFLFSKTLRPITLIVCVIYCLIYLCQCSRLNITKSPKGTGTGKYYLVPIYFTTDRNKTENSDPRLFFGSSYSKNLTYGKLEVSVPYSHSFGIIDVAPWWKMWDARNKSQFMTLSNLTIMDYNILHQKISQTVKLSSKQDILVFIHGYNNSFEDAALRAGQITFDLSFEGASILYSWPSNGEIESYVSDEENIRLTVLHLKSFLTNLISTTSPKNVHIIAHSMGNRALTEALKAISIENTNIHFNQIILAAPDINKQLFEQDIVPYIPKIANRLTIYSSTKDRALLASQKVHKYVRVGNSNYSYNGFQTIDISKINCDDVFKHGCFAEARPVLTDIYDLLRSDLEPEKRNLKKVNNNYWEIKKD